MENRIAEILRKEKQLDRRTDSATSLTDAFAILKEGGDLMDEVTELARESLTPEERAEQDRYHQAVIEPTAEVFGAELRSVLDEKGPKAMIRAAAAIFKDLAAQIDEIERRNRHQSD
jgi:hypothetical protein